LQLQNVAHNMHCSQQNNQFLPRDAAMLALSWES